MRLRARLQRLERHHAFDGSCPACRQRRGQTVSVFSSANDDGTITEPEEMPTACERCGDIPERVLHFVEVVVGGSADTLPEEALAQWAASDNAAIRGFAARRCQEVDQRRTCHETASTPATTGAAHAAGTAAQ